MIERRVRNFKLDSRLRKFCADDVYAVCAFFGVSRPALPAPPLALPGLT